jgi:hypothetical protein
MARAEHQRDGNAVFVRYKYSPEDVLMCQIIVDKFEVKRALMINGKGLRVSIAAARGTVQGRVWFLSSFCPSKARWGHSSYAASSENVGREPAVGNAARRREGHKLGDSDGWTASDLTSTD